MADASPSSKSRQSHICICERQTGGDFSSANTQPSAGEHKTLKCHPKIMSATNLWTPGSSFSEIGKTQSPGFRPQSSASETVTFRIDVAGNHEPTTSPATWAWKAPWGQTRYSLQIADRAVVFKQRNRQQWDYKMTDEVAAAALLTIHTCSCGSGRSRRGRCLPGL